jgi:Fe-S-cluster containining protein
MLREAVEQASKRADVREAIARVYGELQSEIDLRRPRCEMSGRCCRFDEYGHRMYVTTMELAAFVHEYESTREKSNFQLTIVNSQLSILPASGACRFQDDGLCSVHTIRPFGCRIFFCDETATQWQQEQYERFHAQIKRLHEELNVPYLYIEWRTALRELDAIFMPG